MKVIHRKKAIHGHNVSHAKNRTKRLFRPNNQLLKVLRNGRVIRVTLQAKYIQRLKKYGKVGPYRLYKPGQTAKKEAKKVVAQAMKTVAKTATEIKKTVEKKTSRITEKAASTLDISSIVGKKS